MPITNDKTRFESLLRLKLQCFRFCVDERQELIDNHKNYPKID